MQEALPEKGPRTERDRALRADWTEREKGELLPGHRHERGLAGLVGLIYLFLISRLAYLARDHRVFGAIPRPLPRSRLKFRGCNRFLIKFLRKFESPTVRIQLSRCRCNEG